ncbi:M20/M25/M40 family metallo-hydrolase [Sphingomonas sp. QA11]|uniref:M20/M25/M40 family metallo-hydrolase n=1 Tax=Sphingomonas sp. QA11 TaxID=2950605 RepID=UPI00234BD0BE|nr:M20/M25/M40 family metallo-hydrolase [Sphingomonas sp. QA11]WCM27801.1 M20/M25/M40 family metallo-hydrolase [Sphingomonas sp. QA11]
MHRFLPLAALVQFIAVTPAVAQDTPDPARLKATVEKLVSFGTRHSLSSTDDPVRGIGAARRWAAGELTRISDGCGGCITSANIARSFTGPRAPNGVEIVDVLGFQQGIEPRRVIIIGAHIDSRVTDVMNATSDAPGANDNGSGVALVLEAARILSKEKFRATIVYALFSGEEQGLWGGTLLAETAKEKKWTVSAMLNNDIVGNTIGENGARVADRVRVFSEGIGAAEDLPTLQKRRQNGGEDDGPSRALAKAVDGIAGKIKGGIDVFVDRRPDRFGRGGDHSPFLALGYPAIRFTVAAENWKGQHQDVRAEKGVAYGDTVDKMDFDYLAKVTAINVATIRRLAAAPAAPSGVTISGALGYDTTVKWQLVDGATGYRVHWRRNDARDWQKSIDLPASAVTDVLKGVPVDDHFVGVSALGTDGAESLVTFAGP